VGFAVTHDSDSGVVDVGRLMELLLYIERLDNGHTGCRAPVSASAVHTKLGVFAVGAAWLSVRTAQCSCMFAMVWY
jgi:hypothetical protein